MTPQMTLRKWLAAAAVDDDAASRGDLAMKSCRVETTTVIADLRQSEKKRRRALSVSGASLFRVSDRIVTFNRESQRKA